MSIATPDLRAFIASQIKAGRERLHMSQQELAQLAGLPAAQSVSEIENCQREVRATELYAIAETLHLDVTDLLRGVPKPPQALWRGHPDDPSLRAQAEARIWQRCRHYQQAEEWMDIQHRPALPFALGGRAPRDRAAAAEIASGLRDWLKLGSYPALSLVKAMEERLGVKVMYEEGLPGSALCMRDEDLAVIVINAEQVPWRRNYSVAHELFHFVTWDTMPPAVLRANPRRWKQSEKLADAFAEALLLPAEALRDRLDARGRAKLDNPIDILELAREFCVSTEALLWRLVHLHWFSEAKAEKLLADDEFKRMDRLMGRPKPEVDTLSSRFFQLLLLAHAKGRVSVGRIAEMTGLNLLEVRDRVAALHSKDG